MLILRILDLLIISEILTTNFSFLKELFKIIFSLFLLLAVADLYRFLLDTLKNKKKYSDEERSTLKPGKNKMQKIIDDILKSNILKSDIHPKKIK